MILVRARPSDAKGIAALHAESWRAAYRGSLSDDYLRDKVQADREAVWSERLNYPPPNQYVVLAEQEGELAGFGCVYVNENEEWGSLLDNLHVKAGLQGQGLGRRLVLDVAEWCLKQGFDNGLYLWVFQKNVVAQTFYQKLGAVPLGEDLWQPPGGEKVPSYRFGWKSVSELVRRLGITRIHP